MKKFCIFIDESGNHTVSSLKQSPFYTVCGLLINQDYREKLKTDFENLKKIHFGKKNYIIHGTEIKRYFQNHPQKLSSFIKDLKKLINNTSFFLLFATLDKAKAQKIGWSSKTNGTKDPIIKPIIIKKHLTSLNFVTKANNDPEEQLADLFSVCGKINLQIQQKQIIEKDLQPLDHCLYKIMSKKLFKNQAHKTDKISLYNKINSLNILP